MVRYSLFVLFYFLCYQFTKDCNDLQNYFENKLSLKTNTDEINDVITKKESFKKDHSNVNEILNKIKSYIKPNFDTQITYMDNILFLEIQFPDNESEILKKTSSELEESYHFKHTLKKYQTMHNSVFMILRKFIKRAKKNQADSLVLTENETIAFFWLMSFYYGFSDLNVFLTANSFEMIDYENEKSSCVISFTIDFKNFTFSENTNVENNNNIFDAIFEYLEDSYKEIGFSNMNANKIEKKDLFIEHLNGLSNINNCDDQNHTDIIEYVFLYLKICRQRRSIVYLFGFEELFYNTNNSEYKKIILSNDSHILLDKCLTFLSNKQLIMYYKHFTDQIYSNRIYNSFQDFCYFYFDYKFFDILDQNLLFQIAILLKQIEQFVEFYEFLLDSRFLKNNDLDITKIDNIIIDKNSLKKNVLKGVEIYNVTIKNIYNQILFNSNKQVSENKCQVKEIIIEFFLTMKILTKKYDYNFEYLNIKIFDKKQIVDSFEHIENKITNLSSYFIINQNKTNITYVKNNFKLIFESQKILHPKKEKKENCGCFGIFQRKKNKKVSRRFKSETIQTDQKKACNQFRRNLEYTEDLFNNLNINNYFLFYSKTIQNIYESKYYISSFN
ncbi:hypothetical protein GVAV_000698 [Gurleya vavrai]